MTPRDRFLKTLRFEKPDLPFVETPGAWIGVYYGPVPQFQRQIVEEDERTITYINREGILMREFKQYGGNSSMPQFLRFPVENEEDFERFRRERLGLNFWGGFFGPLRNMMGLENLLLGFLRFLGGYGRRLIGGIDKRAVAMGGKAMRREVDRVMPLVEEEGYIPDLDHGAPPDISWPNRVGGEAPLGEA